MGHQQVSGFQDFISHKVSLLVYYKILLERYNNI